MESCRVTVRTKGPTTRSGTRSSRRSSLTLEIPKRCFRRSKLSNRLESYLKEGGGRRTSNLKETLNLILKPDRRDSIMTKNVVFLRGEKAAAARSVPQEKGGLGEGFLGPGDTGTGEVAPGSVSAHPLQTKSRRVKRGEEVMKMAMAGYQGRIKLSEREHLRRKNNASPKKEWTGGNNHYHFFKGEITRDDLPISYQPH